MFVILGFGLEPRTLENLSDVIVQEDINKQILIKTLPPGPIECKTRY